MQKKIVQFGKHHTTSRNKDKLELQSFTSLKLSTLKMQVFFKCVAVITCNLTQFVSSNRCFRKQMLKLVLQFVLSGLVNVSYCLFKFETITVLRQCLYDWCNSMSVDT